MLRTTRDCLKCIDWPAWVPKTQRVRWAESALDVCQGDVALTIMEIAFGEYLRYHTPSTEGTIERRWKQLQDTAAMSRIPKRRWMFLFDNHLRECGVTGAARIVDPVAAKLAPYFVRYAQKRVLEAPATITPYLEWFLKKAYAMIDTDDRFFTAHFSMMLEDEKDPSGVREADTNAAFEMQRAFSTLSDQEDVQEFIFATDNTTRDGQGTTYTDVVVLLYYQRTTKRIYYGIIEYDPHRNLRKAVHWGNAHWSAVFEGTMMPRLQQIAMLELAPLSPI